MEELTAVFACARPGPLGRGLERGRDNAAINQCFPTEQPGFAGACIVLLTPEEIKRRGDAARGVARSENADNVTYILKSLVVSYRVRRLSVGGN